MNRPNIIENISFIPTQTIEMFNYKILPNSIKEYYSKLKNYSFIRDEKGFYDLKTLLIKNKENKDNFIYRHDIRDILEIKNNYVITGIKDEDLKDDRILYINFKKNNWIEKLQESINNIVNKYREQKQNKINIKFYILMKDKNNIFINNKGELYNYEDFKQRISDNDYIYEPYLPLNFDITPKIEIVSLFKEIYNVLNNKSLLDYKNEYNNYNKIMFLYNYDKLEDDIDDSLKLNTTTIYNLKGCYFITKKTVYEKKNIYDSNIPIIGTLELLNKDTDLYRFKIISLKDVKLKKNVKKIDTIDIYIKKKWNFINYTYKIKGNVNYEDYNHIFLKEKGDIIEYDNKSLRSGILTSKKLYRDLNKELDVFFIPRFYNIESNKFKKLYSDKSDIALEGLQVFSDTTALTKYIDIIDIQKKDELNRDDIDKSINELIKIIMKNNNKFYIRNIKEAIKNDNIFYKYNIIYKNIENIENIFKGSTLYNIKNIKDEYKEYFNPTILQNIKLKNIDYIVFIKLELFKKNTNVKLDCKYTLKNIKKYLKKVILDGGCKTMKRTIK